MSRICVKNIGKNATEAQLRETFSTKGEVTDVRIIKTASGKSRQFAFVGFRNEDQAAAVQKYFNNTFLGTSRIVVEIAKKVGEADLTNARSRHSQKKVDKIQKRAVADTSRVTTPPKAVANSDKEADPSKREFLAAMKNRSQKKFWTNDDALPSNEAQPTNDNDIDSDECDEEDVNDSVMHNEVSVVSDMDFLRSKVRKSVTAFDSDSEQSDNASGEEEDNEGIDEEIEVEDIKDVSSNVIDAEEEIDDEGRLFVRNLPYSCTEDDLKLHFEVFGPVSTVHISIDNDKKSKGYGFVQFLLPEHAAAAKEALDGAPFQGRLLHVLPAKKMKVVEKVPENLNSFQAKKEAERRASINKKDNWNASFVRTDTVIDNIAHKYNISHDEVLNTNIISSGEMAVRVAIGETNVIAENKAYFAEHGVDIGVLESATSSNKADKRSDTTILVKNLPFDMVPEELQDMFSKFGTIVSFLVPPSKSLALIDFSAPVDARKAFKSLAYRKYHHTPLYLEFAPLNTIKASPAANATTKNKEKKDKEKVAEVVENDDFSTLYIKNLSFSTTEESLKKHLVTSCHINPDAIRTISLPKKHKDQKVLSMGYGFIEFNSLHYAGVALQKISGSVLDGHALEVKPSDKRITVPRQAATSVGSAKLIVRNLAFQATKHDLMTLFSSFGSVKRVRIPKKVGNSHRGFAFVDFNTAQEASIAMKSLANTHLYGRHLVIEYAKDEENDMDNVRKRAEKDMSSIFQSTKRRKMNASIGEKTVDMSDAI